MIEVVAELSRGPVFLAGEALECVVTVTNPLPPTATSASSEALAWASAQIHCQFHASESRVALPPPDSSQPDVQPESQTVFLPHRGERGQCILSTPPKILFCDLRLDPGESKSYSYSEVLPIEGPPSFRGQSVKYVYKLTIGCQRVNSPITLLRVPLRVLVLTGLQDTRFPQDEAIAPSSPFLEEDEGGKKDSWLAELAGERLMAATSCRSLRENPFRIVPLPSPTKAFLPYTDSPKCHILPRIHYLTSDYKEKSHLWPLSVLDILQCGLQAYSVPFSPDLYNISDGRGKVGTFGIFKSVYRLGEDVVGTLNLGEGTVACLQFSVSLQTEEHVQPEYQRRRGAGGAPSVSHVTHARHQESCLHTTRTSFSLPIPLSSTPGFCTAIVSLKWRLHFEFVTSREPGLVLLPPLEQPEPVTWTGPEQVPVDTFSWDLPIKVLPTSPTLVSYAAPGPSTSTITI
ncbi:RAB6A-GEF complex partner protein 2 isoform X1 [Diceros bicornis minor]|uniref:RAB6A-GEF complex partner protein 2 isoform X1 n=1 Tax=Diceros bicornis minor TaxID=77932 RepID=UPI0026F237E2|nr:RAB6A-GEF complex partner protein 2 isoform X1 [Diceros bicornis minor]